MILIGTKQFATNSECHFVFQVFWSCKFTEQFYRVSNNCYSENIQHHDHIRNINIFISVMDRFRFLILSKRIKNGWQSKFFGREMKSHQALSCRLLWSRSISACYRILSSTVFPFTINNYFDYLPVLLHFN